MNEEDMQKNNHLPNMDGRNRGLNSNDNGFNGKLFPANLVFGLVLYSLALLFHNIEFGQNRFGVGVTSGSIGLFVINNLPVYVWTALKHGWYITIVFSFWFYIKFGVKKFFLNIPILFGVVFLTEEITAPVGRVVYSVIWDLVALAPALIIILSIEFVVFVFKQYR